MAMRILRIPILILASTALLASCATTKNDVDVTPTARITVDAHVGKQLSPDRQKVQEISNHFAANDTVYAAVDVPGRLDGTLRVRWMQGTTQLQEQSMTLMEDVHSYMFQLAPAAGGNATGEYTLEVWVNNDRVETEKFEVGQ